MKKILGLDLGTNSIGWALVERNFDEPNNNTLGEGKIIGMGSRIIPMTQDVLDKFGKGQSHSQTAERTGYRGVRRLRQRHLLRRERLHRVLNIIGALPKHYAQKIDFTNKKGQFINNEETKINYLEDGIKKFEFIFKSSFEEMLSEFKEAHPELFYTKNNGQETKIPYDWTVYFLRKKALTKRVSLQELAWVLLNFNQKRGYYQLRGEEQEEDNTKLVEFHALKVVGVVAEEPNPKNETWYKVELENGWVYPKKSKVPIDDWIGKTKEFIVTTTLNEDGTVKTDKEGIKKRSFKAVDSEQDWIAIKKSTEEKIENTKQFVGTYIYRTLLKNPKQKINGKLVRTIERHFYKDELTAILKKQTAFHPELNNKALLKKGILELYPNNYAQQNILKQRDFIHLLVNDIIFYQRPLKSKKSLINDCKYETRNFVKEGKRETKAIKAIHKSHPLFQEFRLWQFIDNIRIYEREKIVDGKLLSDVHVTSEFIPDEDAKVKLFDFFNDKAKIKQKAFLANYKDSSGKKLSEEKYRWNYVEDKEYPLNETRALFILKLSKLKTFDWKGFLTQENEIKLWHILYSISDKKELERVFDNPDFKLDIPFETRQEFKKTKPFSNDYGTLSEKAIKKVLPLMRAGKYWSFSAIDEHTKNRIQKIIDGEYDDKIKNRVREKAIGLQTENDFKALPLWLASYIVYSRHSESIGNTKWNTPNQIKHYLENEFKQHALRNPIVEQVITETLRVVHDIWQQYGNGKKDFFDEIHIELGREMKNTKNERERLSKVISKNQDTNERIRALLREFKEEEIEGVMPHSPNQQEKLKIFENDILSRYSEKDLDKEFLDGINIAKVSKSPEPTAKEIQKYRLWMEQKYRSPYTGQVIPLSKLFTTDYEVEHIIPQARYFDDSYGNKVICEAEVNKTKGNQTAFEFLSKNPGRIIDLGQKKQVPLFNLNSYQDFVSKNFKKGSKKFKFLLSEDVPEQFIARQINDTRYISKTVKSLLSNIVRTDNEQESTSKNLVPVTGGVTAALKKDWGLEDKWNELILPRFKRLNELFDTNEYTYFNDKKNVSVPDVPKELKKGFNKKRIDHRHHAMDALVVALATRNHVSYLGNEHAKSENKRYDLRNKLRRVEKLHTDEKTIKVSKEFYLPWKEFPVDAKKALDNMVVSFKQNLRVINKASNKYQLRKNDKTEIRKQAGINWAIRKPLHKETVYGKVNLMQETETIGLHKAISEDYTAVNQKYRQEISILKEKGLITDEIIKELGKSFEKKLKKIEVFSKISAVRKPVDESFKSGKWISESVTDRNIQEILINHLKQYNEIDEKGRTKERPDLAFSVNGLEEMNKNIKILNKGKPHQPIYRVRVYETLGNKFAVGHQGNKKKKYVEAAKGTNLFFAIYGGINKKAEVVRQYETVPLNIVIERQKQNLSSVSDTYYDKDKNEYHLLFSLSPNDLVYVPSDEELQYLNSIDFSSLSIEQKKRIYKMVSCSGNQCFFIRNDIAVSVANKKEFTALNKMERDLDGIMIKERCIKLKVDRLGNIK